jgi:hypothetical protein
MSTVTHRRLRIACNTAGYDAPRDQMTGRAARVFRGASYRFELALFFGAEAQINMITDLSNFAAVKLEIKEMGADNSAPDPDDAPLVSVLTNEFNSALTWAAWNTTRDNQHLVIEATKGEMAVPTAGKKWLVVSAYTSDSPSKIIPLIAGPIEVDEDGSQEGGTPPPPVESYYTSDEVDAMFAAELDLNYIGTFDASGGVFPDIEGLAAKDYYLVTVGGTISGTLYKVSDRLIFNGAGWDLVHAPGSDNADAAAASATAAAASATASAGSATAASGSATAASGSATSAATSATAAATSATAAANSATAAGNSATAAASSASTALNAIALAFKGGVAGASVPATSTLAGDYYEITSAGTSQSKTWAIGDRAIYNGTSGSWTQQSGYFTAAQAADAYRAPEAWTYIDGATTNRAAGVFALGTRGNIAGAPTASWVGWVDVPTANPASSAWASSIQSNTSGFFPANNIGISFASNGALLVNADAGGGNYRNYQWLGFRAAYSGQRIWLEVRFTQGTSNPVIRVNGIDISSTFIVVTGGTPPSWLASSLVATYCLNGFNWLAGRAPRGVWINAHLTDAESDDWRLRGVIPAWVRSGGSAKLAVNSDFSAGSDGWSAANGTVTGNVDSIGGVNDTLEINAAGGTSAAGVVGHGLFVRAGDKARVRFDIYRPSSNTAGTWIGLRNSGSALSDQAVQPVADTWTSYDVVMTWPQTNDPGLQFRLAVSPSSGGTLGTADKFYLKNVKVSPLGALILPEVTPDNILRDASLSTPPIDGYTVGCTPQTGAADGWIRGGGSGAGYVMADTVLIGTGRSIAEIWMYSVSGGTASLGESSGSTATLAASTSLTAGIWTKVTPLKAISSTGKLYRGLGTATDSYVAVRTMPRGTQP